MTDAQKLQTMANYANVLLSHARMNQGEFMSLIDSNTKKPLYVQSSCATLAAHKLTDKRTFTQCHLTAQNI